MLFRVMKYRAVVLGSVGITVCIAISSCIRSDSHDDTCDVVGPSVSQITISTPDSLTIWKIGNCCDTIRWSGAGGDSVQLRIFIDSEFVSDLDKWIANDGEYVTQKPWPSYWEASNAVRVQILDRKGNVGWSPVFRFERDTFATIIVISPNARSSWRAGMVPAEKICWSVGSALTSGDSVRIELFGCGGFIDTLILSTPNDGCWQYQRRLDCYLGCVNGYRLRITDSKGYYGWSENFTILPDSCATITVTTPHASTVWFHGHRGFSVAWLTGCTDSVRLELWRDDRHIDTISSWIVNTGSYLSPSIVKPSWGEGLNVYQVKIRSRNGQYGFSSAFSIQKDTMQILSVLQPSFQTIWRWGQDSIVLSWRNSTVDSIRVEIYKKNFFLGEILPWTRCDSTLRIAGDILKKIRVFGSFITVKVVDANGYWGWSDIFVIDTTGSLVVTEPRPAAVWLHGDTGRTVAWKGVAGDSVRAEIFKGDSMIGVFSSWRPVPVGGKVSSDSAIAAAWGIGDDYRIRLYDSRGNYGWSSFFSLRADTIQRMWVVYPDSSTFWHVRQTSTIIRIVYADSAAAESVRCILFFGEDALDTLTPWVPHDDELRIDLPLSWNIKPSKGYRIKVIDNMYRYAWSTPFRICADSLQRLDVRIPFKDSIYHGKQNILIQWKWSSTPAVDSVMVLLYRREALIDTLAIWGEDTGSFLFVGPLPSWWGTGGGFFIKVIANDSSYGVSDIFVINADSLNTVTVIEPGIGTTWRRDDSLFVVEWQGAPTESVTVTIYKEDTYLEIFCRCWGESMTACSRMQPLPAMWGSGNDYRLLVTTQDGRYGWSGYFSIMP